MEQESDTSVHYDNSFIAHAHIHELKKEWLVLGNKLKDSSAFLFGGEGGGVE